MTHGTVRSWFTPQLIITLAGIGLSGAGAWYGLRSDFRSVAEEQVRQHAALDELKGDVKDVSDKIPDGKVIELRLGQLERKTDALDPAMLLGMKTDIEVLKGHYGELQVFKDQVKGRIWGVRGLPYRERWSQEQ